MTEQHATRYETAKTRNETEALPDAERREALKKVAKYTAYAAPALLALMSKPAKAQIGSFIPGCDRRLKRDIQEIGCIPNGIKTYAFRYWNDDRIFAGVMAQDLLEDARFKHAVITDKSGYYRVDLEALGLCVFGSPDQLMDASKKALAEAAPVAN